MQCTGVLHVMRPVPLRTALILLTQHIHHDECLTHTGVSTSWALSQVVQLHSYLNYFLRIRKALDKHVTALNQLHQVHGVCTGV